MSRRVIDVDFSGKALDGEELMVASPDAVAMGMVEVEHVTLRYPNGYQEQGETIRITAKGMETLKREFGGAA